jgi:HlyD family secretion protein
MFKPFEKILTVILIAFLFSCQLDKGNESAQYRLFPDSYVDDLVLEGSVQAMNSSTIVCPSHIEGTIIFLIEDGAMVKQGDTVCIIENREITDYYETMIDRVEQTRAQYNKGKADLEMSFALLMAQVKSNEAQTAITNLDSAQLQYLSPQQRKVKELQLKIASVEKEKYQTRLSFLEKINDSELKRLQLQIQQTQSQADRIKSIIDGMVMVAPLNGMALRSQSRQTRSALQEGDLVWEGMPLVEIPDLSKVRVTIMASEPHYKRIKVGNSVSYTFDAMPGNLAWGKIERKASVGQSISRNSKVRQFEVSATVDSFLVLPEVGLSAKARILLTQITDTIVVPQLAIFDDDSLKVVYVKQKGNNYEKRQVVLGKASPTNAIIAAGLQGDETLSFIKPKNARINSEVYLPDSVVNFFKNNNEIDNDMPMFMESGSYSEEFYYENMIIIIQ